MAKKRETGQDRPIRRLPKLLAWGSFGLGIALAGGCSQTPIANTPQAHDPLNGVMTPPGIPQPTGAPKATTASNIPTNPQWGAQGDLSSTNTATLAGMSGQGPLGRPLAIDDKGRTAAPGQLTSSSSTQQTPTANGFPAPNSNPKVEPVPDARPANPTVTPTSNWQNPAPVQPAVQTVPVANTEALAKQLQDRGVINTKQEVVAGGLHLTCYVSAGTTGGLRILEVTAADYPTAAQAILKQLDNSK